MAELEEYQESISTNLQHLEDLINRSPLFTNNHSKWLTQINK